jgi:hypothetical protein
MFVEHRYSRFIGHELSASIGRLPPETPGVTGLS